MKVNTHSYALSLTRSEKDIIILGIMHMIKTEKLSPANPKLMARALEILSNIDGIALIITSWDAEHILFPALNNVPVNLIDDDFYSKMNKIAHRWSGVI